MPENKSAAGTTKIGPGTATKNRSLKATLRWLTATEHQNQSCLFVFNRSLSVSDNSDNVRRLSPYIAILLGLHDGRARRRSPPAVTGVPSGGTDHDAADAEGGAGIDFGVLTIRVLVSTPPQVARVAARVSHGLATRN